MTAFALSLVLASSLLHALWNLLAKQSGGGVAFVWLVAAASAALYAPAVAALVVLKQPVLGVPQLLLMAGSGVLHVGYFVALQRGYRVADLSLVYPLARGVGPALSLVGAVAFLGERPSTAVLAGGLSVIAGVALISTGGAGGLDGARLNAGVRYGLLTGALIAAYTLWDKLAVSGPAGVPPLLEEYSSAVARFVLLAPPAWRRRDEVRRTWETHRMRVLGVAVLSPFAFILVLTALVTAPVSYVAPAREVSILFGVVLGARVLSETQTRRRMLASGLMLAGITAIGLG